MTTQVHGDIAVPQPHGGALRPFARGNRANPGGRVKGLAALVRAQTAEGAELVAFMLKVLRSPKRPLRLRMEAAVWLADRGWGRATLPVTDAEGGPMRFTLVLSAAGAPGEADDGDG